MVAHSLKEFQEGHRPLEKKHRAHSGEPESISWAEIHEVKSATNQTWYCGSSGQKHDVLETTASKIELVAQNEKNKAGSRDSFVAGDDGAAVVDDGNDRNYRAVAVVLGDALDE